MADGSGAMSEKGDAAAARIKPVGPNPAETTHDRLRRTTAKVHVRLHAYSGFVRLMSGNLALPDYGSLLARLYGFYAPLEARLENAPTQWRYGLDMLTFPKAALLAVDLASLGVSARRVSALPICGRLPEIAGPGAFVGCAYVIEGAAAGGRIMAKRLDGLLGPDTRNGRHFFLGARESDSTSWSTCCAAIEQCSADGCEDAMVTAAVDTFAALEDWLHGGGDHVQAA